MVVLFVWTGLDFRFLVLSLLESLPFLGVPSHLDCDHRTRSHQGPRSVWALSFRRRRRKRKRRTAPKETKRTKMRPKMRLVEHSPELHATRCYSRCPHRLASSASDPSAALVFAGCPPLRQSPHGSSSTGAEQSPRPPSKAVSGTV